MRSDGNSAAGMPSDGNSAPLACAQVKAKLTRPQVHALMSHHFQGTWFDPSKDIGAGAELSPYRWYARSEAPTPDQRCSHWSSVLGLLCVDRSCAPLKALRAMEVRTQGLSPRTSAVL